MRLAGHSDPRTHMGYVMETAALQAVPETALPALPTAMTVESSRPVTIQGGKKEKPQRFQRATEDSNLRPPAPEAGALSS
jgi:hypothetical protein